MALLAASYSGLEQPDTDGAWCERTPMHSHPPCFKRAISRCSHSTASPCQRDVTSGDNCSRARPEELPPVEPVGWDVAFLMKLWR
eukprot:CAMPEP_0117472206 /NCGR_PEP_ID=MMETSP0784-20121206/8124_1 /TAXON_ID=39447 /ORGANISM="" /LENGTH=84 /DNA_ID=CAMNT_0005266343 /DNA_START=351 /DNA_END=605 /DNA_ORIENTATION=-